MVGVPLRILTVLLCLVWTSAVTLADGKQFGPFQVDTLRADVIALDGLITGNAALDFRRALMAAPQAKLVVLNSPGGSVSMALLIADDIHVRGLATLIPPGSQCYSACAYLFLAGRERVAEGRLGVHQISADEPDLESAQIAISDIIDLLNTFDTPIEVLTVMFRTPSTSMHVFTPEEMAEYRIERRAGVAATASSGPPAATSPQETPPAPSPEAFTAPSLPDVAPAARPPADSTATAEPALSVVEDHAKRPNRIAVYTGLDFYGGDLGAERVGDLAACAGRCLEIGNQCRAFTFNADDRVVKGPNCFLKSESRSADGNAVAISGVLLRRSDPDPPAIVVGVIDPKLGLLKDLDIPGGDLTGTPYGKAGTAGLCRLACVRNTRCGAFTFIKDNKQCWLKGGGTATSYAPGMVSGVKQTMSFSPIRIIRLDR
ncbi:PAN domain-containing protein [Oharaeibacter diazotrophicus]|uniref:Apple domain-containing protein n=1 Tax=Oharaeibacter diazotrophicus TaxID=1920512 RepID=A0A4R6RAW2_9HYPH|nr:PAN domain-containing protein [Oharaeibacter diazotrophicus]TDP83169.1 hypothetical protein EDD54_3126 [Oharaeibacter diazotrophicus]BBE71998.1 PAN domain protein [Pleomorphomonas sp. SM30]GLS78763.1 hypothetical protein GCM10007904_41000 [Oharaeibacter diazotrophicus]